MHLTKFAYVIFGCRHRYRSSACTNSNRPNHTIWCFCFGCSTLSLSAFCLFAYVLDRGEFGKMQITNTSHCFRPHNLCADISVRTRIPNWHSKRVSERGKEENMKKIETPPTRQSQTRHSIYRCIAFNIWCAFESATTATAHNMHKRMAPRVQRHVCEWTIKRWKHI